MSDREFLSIMKTSKVVGCNEIDVNNAVINGS